MLYLFLHQLIRGLFIALTTCLLQRRTLNLCALLSLWIVTLDLLVSAVFLDWLPTRLSTSSNMGFDLAISSHIFFSRASVLLVGPLAR